MTGARSGWRMTARGVCSSVVALCRRYNITVLRIALGVVYVWFGALKLLPDVSPAEEMATRTMSEMTFHHIPSSIELVLLGVMEVLIGLGLVGGRLPRLTMTVFFVHMSGTFLALVLLPGDTWDAWHPTLAGQYVIKNVVLVAAGLTVAVHRVPRGAPEAGPKSAPDAQRNTARHTPARGTAPAAEPDLRV